MPPRPADGPRVTVIGSHPCQASQVKLAPVVYVVPIAASTRLPASRLPSGAAASSTRMALAFHAKAILRSSPAQRSASCVYCQPPVVTLTAANLPDGADQECSSAPVGTE